MVAQLIKINDADLRGEPVLITFERRAFIVTAEHDAGIVRVIIEVTWHHEARPS